MQPDRLPFCPLQKWKGDKNMRQDRKRQASVESVFCDLEMFLERLTQQTVAAKDA